MENLLYLSGLTGRGIIKKKRAFEQRAIILELEKRGL